MSGAAQINRRRLPSERKPPRRRTSNCGGGVRAERESAKRSIVPDSHPLQLELDVEIEKNDWVEERDGSSSSEVRGKSGGRVGRAVSARKLGAGIWRRNSTGFRTDRCKSLGFQCESSFKISNSAMEGPTNFPNQATRSPLIPTLQKKLKQARARINALETERISSKKKLEQFLRKLGDERRREDENVGAIIDDTRAELRREKKTCQRLETAHSKLVNKLAEAKVSAKRCQQQYGKQRKAREFAEEVCDELVRGSGEIKSELELLKLESRKLWEEVDEERKMLQMAEVWREEQVQKKLIDTKIMLEDKYSNLNLIIKDLETFLKQRSVNADLKDMNKMELLKELK